jgi:hypothetical protein
VAAVLARVHILQEAAAEAHLPREFPVQAPVVDGQAMPGPKTGPGSRRVRCRAPITPILVGASAMRIAGTVSSRVGSCHMAQTESTGANSPELDLANRPPGGNLAGLGALLARP